MKLLFSMEVADLLLFLGIYFGSAQVQSSNILNISCQGSGLVLFSADHNILQNSWKISPRQYCLFASIPWLAARELRNGGRPGLQTQATWQPKLCNSFHLLWRETQYIFPSGRCTSSAQKTLSPLFEACQVSKAVTLLLHHSHHLATCGTC